MTRTHDDEGFPIPGADETAFAHHCDEAHEAWERESGEPEPTYLRGSERVTDQRERVRDRREDVRRKIDERNELRGRVRDLRTLVDIYRDRSDALRDQLAKLQKRHDEAMALLNVSKPDEDKLATVGETH